MQRMFATRVMALTTLTCQARATPTEHPAQPLAAASAPEQSTHKQAMVARQQSTKTAAHALCCINGRARLGSATLPKKEQGAA